MKRQATEREENEVKIEKRRWKKHKGRDIPRILSATYCSKRTKAGNGASHSETLTIKRKEGRRKKRNSNIKCKQSKTKNKRNSDLRKSGERSKEGCRKETEDRRDIKKEARKEVLLKGEEKKRKR